MVNPFARLRQQQMFQQPVNRQSAMGGFNPAMQAPPMPEPSPWESMLPTPEPPAPPKRFQTGTDPRAEARQGMIASATNIKSSGADVKGYNPTIPPVTPATFDPANSPYFKQAQGMRNENRPLKSEYQEALTTGRPTPADYDPSKKRRLAAIIGGAMGGLAAGPGAGIKTASTILEQPYNLVMNDYQQRIAGLRDAAGIEAQDLDAKLGDLKTASDLEIQQTGINQKQQEINLKGIDTVTRAQELVSEHMQRLGNINHQLNQDLDAEKRTYLEGLKADALMDLQKSQGKLAEANAAAAPRHASAHEATAAAAGVAAKRPLGGSRAKPNYKEARQEAYAKLFSDPTISKYGAIIENTGSGGGYKINEDKVSDRVGPNGETIGQLIEKKIQEILERQQAGSEDGGSGDENPYEDPNSNYAGSWMPNQ